MGREKTGLSKKTGKPGLLLVQAERGFLNPGRRYEMPF